MTTETERTHQALERLSHWGQDPSTDGGENIAFSLARQGSPGDAFLINGDCTPFTPHGARGSLHGQPAGDTGEPSVYIDDFSVSPPGITSLACTFEFNLNTGTVYLNGAFPGLASALHFAVAYQKSFVDFGGKNMLFTSRSTSDHAAYAISMQLVGAS